MTDTYTDLANRREVYISRFASYLRNEYSTPNLEDAYKQARLILLDAEAILSRKQLNLLTSAVSSAIAESTNESWGKVTGELDDLAALESSYYAKMFGDVNSVVLAVPLAADVVDRVTKSKLSLDSGQKGAWAKFTKENTDSVTKMFVEQIKTGYGESESIGQINKRLKAVSSGVLKNQAEALIRTGVSHYANESREELMRFNSDIITGKYFNATFDSRTTTICMHFASDPYYDIGDKSAPQLPLHFNERSNWLFLTDGKKIPSGTKPALKGKKSKEAEDKYYRRKEALDKRRDNENITGTTASKVRYRGRKDSDMYTAGQIKGSTPIDEWLRSNPRWFIDSSLGPERAELFISGKVPLKGFADMTGRQLTLKELYDEIEKK